jgi:hypothetical protein
MRISHMLNDGEGKQSGEDGEQPGLRESLRDKQGKQGGQHGQHGEHGDEHHLKLYRKFGQLLTFHLLLAWLYYLPHSLNLLKFQILLQGQCHLAIVVALGHGLLQDGASSYKHHPLGQSGM